MAAVAGVVSVKEAVVFLAGPRTVGIARDARNFCITVYLFMIIYLFIFVFYNTVHALLSSELYSSL